MAEFDTSRAAPINSGIFGLPFSEEESALVFIPIPWEATTSYGGGTSEGPSAIYKASKQVDLYNADVLNPYEVGLFMRSARTEVVDWNKRAKALAAQIIEVGGSIDGKPDLKKALDEVNALGEKLNHLVYQETQSVLKAGKLVGVVGGDHSVPFGAFKAIAEKHPGFGILHFDAHADTRNAYEGFTWSHASIFFNVLENIPEVAHVCQVGIRDFCEQEMDYIKSQKGRVSLFLDKDLKERQYEGKSWGETCREIVANLPQEVWVSFDIDGLDPKLCPHTGTPVPGGIEFSEANYLIGAVVKSGRKIIGFDLNEVAPNLENEADEWDANVGARLLYKLTGWTLASQGKAKLL